MIPFLLASLVLLVGIGVFLLVLWLILPRTEEFSNVQQMLATKEGREKLASMIQASAPTSIRLEVKGCKTCGGYGKLGHYTQLWDGGPTEFTSNQICPDCAGTGLEGGSTYVVVNCIACSGKGAILNEGQMIGGKCAVCNGTGTVKVNKGETYAG